MNELITRIASLKISNPYDRPPLVSCPSTSEFEENVGMTRILAETFPEMLDRIQADQIKHGLKKKQARIADKLHLESLTDQFPGFQLEDSLPPESIHSTTSTELAQGRTRMHPFIVLVFLFIRGWIGEPKSDMFRLFVPESETLRKIYELYAIDPPGLSTISENLNTISEETVDFCLRCQLQYTTDNQLDDFATSRIDSTATHANAVFPTESELIKAFLERTLNGFTNLMKIGLVNLTTRVPFTQVVDLVKEVGHLSQNICLVSGKKGASETRRENYNKIYTRIGRIDKRLSELLDKAKDIFEENRKTFLPSKQNKIVKIISLIQSDLANAATIGEYSSRRINEDATILAHEKILSICDPSASMIIKGGRDVVFGYRPQIAFSGNGLITAILVPEGNAADSGQLKNVMMEVEKNTQVIPRMVTVDDGYVNEPVRQWYLERAIESGISDPIFSVAGSKGKKSLGEELFYSDEYKNARCDRSAAESGIYTLKHNHEFGGNKRRGINSVRLEHKTKGLAYNNRKLIQLMKAKQKRENEARAAIKMKIAPDRALPAVA